MGKLLLFVLFMSYILLLSHVSSATVVCKKFNVQATVTDQTIVFRLSTDLPGDTRVNASVSRLYWEKGSNESYLGSYYDRWTTVHELKRPIAVIIDETRWENELKKKQKMLASFGEPFQVGKISNQVELSITVPINQPNPAFGKGNNGLESPFVSKGSLRVIRIEKKFSIPFGKAKLAAIIGRKQHSLDPNNLELNTLYVISKRTPISNELKPKDPLKAIAQIRYLPPGSVIRILLKHSEGSLLHYFVRADLRGDTHHKVTGWIYSPALMGQDLRVIE